MYDDFAHILILEAGKSHVKMLVLLATVRAEIIIIVIVNSFAALKANPAFYKLKLRETSTTDGFFSLSTAYTAFGAFWI
jgi:hypothetical protein